MLRRIKVRPYQSHFDKRPCRRKWHHAKTKHVDVQLHFIRDHVEKGTINIEYCPTDDMLADILTKGLAREKHGRFLEMMGMGTCEVTTTTPSPSEDDFPIRRNDGQHGAATTSGSVELRGSRPCVTVG
jgi:hypothetical protein